MKKRRFRNFIGKGFGEFKKFAFKGNVFDMAVGIIIGSAFSKIVSSFVADIITPLISLLTKSRSIKEMFVVLGDTNGEKFDTSAQALEKGFATLNYGLFLQNVIDFFIIALSIFMFIKIINISRERIEKNVFKVAEKEVPVAAPTKKECPYCYTEISIKATRCPYCTSKLDE